MTMQLKSLRISRPDRYETDYKSGIVRGEIEIEGLHSKVSVKLTDDQCRPSPRLQRTDMNKATVDSVMAIHDASIEAEADYVLSCGKSSANAARSSRERLRAEVGRLAAQAEPAPAPVGEYPALPEPKHRGPSGTGSYFDAYSADQMRAYIDADRAQRPAREVRLLNGGEFEMLAVECFGLSTSAYVKTTLRKFCEVNGLTVKEQS